MKKPVGWDMSSDMGRKIVCVVGPTACGKTALGILLAKKLGGEVVSADSMQIYKGMTIGTAAPTEEEMDGVPHHMIAVADPAEQWSAARYAQEAIPVIDRILECGKLPILVGGTGLWLDAVVRGHGFAAGCAGGAVRRELEERLAEKGIASLLAELQAVDPEAAERLHPADEKRILRALEVYRETGRTITDHNRETAALPPRYDAIWIGLRFADREDMKRLIDERVDKMAETGLLAEVRRLLSRGLPRNATALQAIGYKEFLGVLEGTATEAEALAEIKLRSRQYAKRQLTWLRRNPAIHWISWEKKRDFAWALQVSTEILSAAGVS
ncbi:MAG: tRNA (adenosine(37)-N6)-dimethylallyltransferase MiaA [Dysosmobacter sp.]|nr:tRNA (adenosine(37)-N6)-dimethylallyltransferase MiaA [Dysosmobacter sp.]